MAKAEKVAIRKVGVRGARAKDVPVRLARILERTGKYEIVAPPVASAPLPVRESPAQPPVVTTDEYDDMKYWDLRRLVNDRGLETEGNTKEDLVRALRQQASAEPAED